jgi:sugar phosphate isomerase/epimerase
MSLNTATVPSLGLAEVIEAASTRGIPAIAPWRSLLDSGAAASGQRIRDAGLRVSSLCRGGMFTAAGPADRARAIDDNRRAIEEAAEIEAGCLVLVCGPVVDKDVGGSFGMVRDGVGAILDDARSAGVRLGIEPLHPMMAADRSVVSTVADALDLLRELDGPEVLGIVIDAYHVWWDRRLPDLVAGVSDRVLGLHVSDWVSPLTGGLTSGRAMMGDGVIDLPGLVASVPWDGLVEVEVLSDEWWARPAGDVIDQAVERFQSHV